MMWEFMTLVIDRYEELDPTLNQCGAGDWDLGSMSWVDHLGFVVVMKRRKT